MTKPAAKTPENAPPQPPAHLAFAPGGELALLPTAFGQAYGNQLPGPVDTDSPICVVPIQGPLMQTEDWWYDSYESILDRVCSALDAQPRAIVLSISSPGGLVSGCFETAQTIRQRCADAGVPLYAYVDGQATSAAYALACAAQSVWCPKAGTVGSIGVITTIVDVSALDKAYGLRYEVITSGARKADGNPHVAISDDARSAIQKRIDDLAAVFFEHVAAERGLTPKAVASQQAAVFLGTEGASVGLVDRVGTLAELVAAIEAGEAIVGPTKKLTAEPTSASASAERNEPTMKTLLRALGLGDNASEAEALSAFQSLASTSQRLVALTGKANAAEAESTIIAWKVGAEKAAELEETIVADRKAQADAEAARIIDAAVVEGRLPPANRALVEGQYQAYGIEALKSTLALLQPVVTPAPKAPAKATDKPADASASTLTEVEREAAKTMGISEEKFLAFKKAEQAKATSNGGAA